MATLEELEKIKREKTPLGRAAITLARRIDRGAEQATGLASLVKQLEATLKSIALDARATEKSPLDRMKDELAARRAQRGA